MRAPRLGAALVLSVASLALWAASAGAQEPTTVPEPTVTTNEEVAADGDGGSPLVFVALSLLGGTTALAILAGQWFRTRPGDAGSG